MNLQKMCRTCLCSDDGNLYSLVASITPRMDSPSSGVVDLWKIYSKILISYDSSYFPETICVECVQKIQQTYQFLWKCEESDAYLRQMNESASNAAENGQNDDGDEFMDISNIKKEKLDYSEYSDYNYYSVSCELETPASTDAPTIELNANEGSTKISSTENPNVSTNNKAAHGMDLLLDIIKEEPEWISPMDSLDLESETSASANSVTMKPVAAKQFACPVCSCRYKSTKSLERHVADRHTDGHICKICNMVFDRNVRRHCLRHIPKSYYYPNSKNYAFKCKLCSKPFRSKTGHDYHQLSKHRIIGPNDNITACSLCSRLFKSNSALEAHMRAHNGERPYNCDYCPKSFVQKGQLTVHLRRHTGEKPYKCDWCPRAFPDKSNFNKHLRHHSQDKPYKCQNCWKGFFRKATLRRHKCVSSRIKCII